MTTVKALSIGSSVTVGALNNTRATVLAILVSGDNCIEYKCAWWTPEGSREVTWLSSYEVDPEEKPNYFQITNKN